MDILPTAKSIVNTIVHMLIAINVYAVWLLASKLNGGNIQTHIILSMIGYQFFLIEATLSLSDHNVWSNLIAKGVRKKVHLVLQVLGVLCIIIGFSLIVSYQKGKHFRTTHGICGLISFILCLTSMTFGIMSYFAPMFPKIRPTPLKAIHTVLGCSTIIMGLITLGIGVNKEIMFEKSISICITVFIACIILYVIINPVTNMKIYIDNMRTTAL